MIKAAISFGVFAVCLAGLVRLDRFFFKHNDSFCIRFTQSTLPYNPDWEVAPLTFKERKVLEPIFNQKFFYLNKGLQSYAFASEDGKYVLKLTRFPSPLRPFPFLSHTFSKFKVERIQKVQNSLKKFHKSFRSYKLAYQDLKEDSGLLYIHLNSSQDLKKMVTVVDKLGAHYQISLDEASFLLQKKAELIFPTLDQLKLQKDNTGARAAIISLVNLIASDLKKGIVDSDPMIYKNYGLLGKRIIHIDVGSFSKKEEVKHPEKLKQQLLETTVNFKNFLEASYPEFLPYYEEAIQKL